MALEEGPDVMLIGLYSSQAELGLVGPNLSVRPLQPISGVPAAIGTALAELNRARRAESIEELPPLVAIACDENESDTLEYMLDTLQVRVIVGPVTSDGVEFALQRMTERSLLVPPFADGPDLEPTATDASGYVLSCRPNRSRLVPSFLEVVAEARRLIAESRATPDVPSEAALAVSADVATASFADGLRDEALAASGVRRVHYGDVSGRSLTSLLMDAQPPIDLVIAASNEDDWAKQITEYDAAYSAAYGRFPYYLLASKRPGLEARAGMPSPASSTMGRQLLGLDYERSLANELARTAFARAYTAEYESPPERGLEFAYDCTYLAVYAAIAAGLRLRTPVLELRPDGIATGFWALQGGGPALSVGESAVPDVISSLRSNRGGDGSLELSGASGDLDLSIVGAEGETAAYPARRYFNVHEPSSELYCLDAMSGAFCDLSIVFPSGGGTPARATNGCRCSGGL